MKQKLSAFFAGFKTGTVKFLREKGIYVAVMAVLAAAGLAVALITGASEPPEQEQEPPSGAVGLSGDESLSTLKTPAPIFSATPSPTPSPVPDFTQAPATPAPTQTSLWSAPVRGEVIWGYAVNELIYSRTLRQWMTHAGVDVASPKGSEVYAVFGGTVEDVYCDDMLGVTVEVSGANGYLAVYANLKEEPPVSEGMKVSAGDVLGYVGDTATSECGDKSHVHFELRREGEPLDPAQYVRFIKE